MSNGELSTEKTINDAAVLDEAMESVDFLDNSSMTNDANDIYENNLYVWKLLLYEKEKMDNYEGSGF